jgi:phosphoribosylamine--glycine ligase
VAEAKERADAAIARIDWPEGYHRHDIGWQAISRERNARLDR